MADFDVDQYRKDFYKEHDKEELSALEITRCKQH